MVHLVHLPFPIGTVGELGHCESQLPPIWMDGTEEGP